MGWECGFARPTFCNTVRQLDRTYTMKRNAIGKNRRQLGKGSLEPWSTVPWRTRHRIGAHHGYSIDGAEHRTEKHEPDRNVIGDASHLAESSVLAEYPTQRSRR
jgi:hypothetical protein